MNKNLQQIALVAVLIVLSASAAVGLRAWLHPPLQLQAAELLATPVAMQNQGYVLTLGDVTFNLDIAKDHWLLVYPATIACPQENTEVLQELSKLLLRFDGVDAQYKPVIVFINLSPNTDPNIDTGQWHRDIQKFSGGSDELARLARVLGFRYDNSNTGATTNCTDHDAPRIYILDPQLRYIGSFVPPHRADTLYSDMQQLIHQLWRYHVQR